ncbi:putative quinol monooxygenase [Rhodococcus sp. X156]|uniref:putative quinol monooxygenase n=1 Tax=Rhodococcus sp. X156 TaxID=2499145 RepID=UPI000FD73AF4|nr:putative quinol monooxygenase [Rhodococcus sp. X156]
MLAVIATLTVREGTGPDFEAAIAALGVQVRENEPGNLLYQLTRSKTEPNVYKMLELYADGAAAKAHGESAHFKEGGKVMAGFLAAAPELEYLDAL